MSPNSSPTMVLQAENVLTEPEISNVRGSYKSRLESQLAAVGSYTPAAAPMLQSQWSDMVWPARSEAVFDPATGVDRDTLVRVGKASVKVPDGFVRVRLCF